MAENMPFTNGNGNGKERWIFGPITVREIVLVVGLTASACLFYFNGQSGTSERINKVEADINQRMQVEDNALGDRISKLETRAAVIEQHQTQSDASIADARTQLGAFAVEIRSQLGKISDQITEFRSRSEQTYGKGPR